MQIAPGYTVSHDDFYWEMLWLYFYILAVTQMTNDSINITVSNIKKYVTVDYSGHKFGVVIDLIEKGLKFLKVSQPCL